MSVTVTNAPALTEVFSGKIGRLREGRVIAGVRRWPGDPVPEDLHLRLREKLRNIGWIVARLPSEVVEPDRMELQRRVEVAAEIEAEAERNRQRLADAPVAQAQRRAALLRSELAWFDTLSLPAHVIDSAL